MFYKPKFCCNCGEKIERTEWSVLASRRFCEFCETEQKHHDLLIRGIVSVCLIFGILGFTGFFTQSEPSAPKPATAPIVSRNLKPAGSRAALSAANAANSTNTGASPAVADASNASPDGQLSKQLDKREKPSEPTYYCGAITKKGTPCTRRVKTIGRCWQHTGRPADPTFEKSEE